MKRTISKLLFTSVAVLSVSLMAGSAMAQESAFGKAAFMENCAVCHGPTGAGDGPVAELFANTPKNLQMLAENNGGAFPFSEVYVIIAGNRGTRGHGTTEMPIWGNIFMAEALPKTIHPGVEPEHIVQARILNLVYYLQSIQM